MDDTERTNDPTETIAAYAQRLREMSGGGHVEIGDDFYAALVALEDVAILEDILSGGGSAFPMAQRCLLAVRGLDLGARSIAFVRSALDCLRFLANREEERADSLATLRRRLAARFVLEFPQARTDLLLSVVLAEPKPRP
ncbi:MAG: hypothetical protein IPK26_17070 [Planctomycetes bacterium]|nr:hypothetical protein [Planctomycetota bacterium]